MDLALRRTIFSMAGIFGQLSDASGSVIAVTLEHAYPDGQSYSPKLPTGIYACARGIHQLASGIPFETFEVTGVPGHSGILFHPGNTNEDSQGCILVGETVVAQEILKSRAAFDEFMALQQGVDQFTLTVS